MIIELNRRTVKTLYLIFIFVDLFFIAMMAFDAGGYFLTANATLEFIRVKLDMKEESNLATWYSSVLLLIAGIVALLNLRVNPFAAQQRWIYRFGWGVIGILFVILSADETGQLHEAIASLVLLSRPVETRNQVHLGAGDWIVYLLPFIIGASLVLFAFSIYSLWSRKRLMIIGLVGVFCWIGTIIAESTEGNLPNAALARPLEGLLEESLEIIGTTLFLITFAEHYQWRQETRTSREEKAVA